MFTLVAKNGMTGYYKSENSIFKIDFSGDRATPEEIGCIPSGADTAREFQPVKVKIDEKRLIEDVKKVVESSPVSSLSEIDNLEIEVIKTARKWMEESSLSKEVPHKIELRTDIFGHATVSAVLYFSEPVPSVWGETKEERVSIKKLPGTYIGNGEVAFHIDFSEMTSPSFFISDSESTNEIISILKKYFIVDVESTEGHLLGAIRFQGVLWGNVERTIHNLKEKLLKEKREAEERRIKEIINTNKSKYEGDVRLVAGLGERYSINDSVVWAAKLMIEDENCYYLKENYLEKISVAAKEIREKQNFYSNEDSVIFEDKRNGIRITVGDIRKSKGVVVLPENIAGQFIGKKGHNVKRLSKEMGIKIKVITQ